MEHMGYIYRIPIYDMILLSIMILDFMGFHEIQRDTSKQFDHLD